LIEDGKGGGKKKRQSAANAQEKLEGGAAAVVLPVWQGGDHSTSCSNIGEGKKGGKPPRIFGPLQGQREKEGIDVLMW